MSEQLPYLPISLLLSDRPCLLVGGGEVALRKARLFLKAGARLTVVSPTIDGDLSELLGDSAILINRAYTTGDCDGMAAVVAASNNAGVNQQVSKDAQQLNIPVNVVDAPALCTFVMPAIIDRSPVSIAISTGGSAPVLARSIRTQIEQMLPNGLGRLARFAAAWRPKVAAQLPEHQRKGFWEGFFSGAIAQRVLSGREQQANAEMAVALADSHEKTPKGEVYLVGAGPGDPDLLTLKALRLMQQADIVFYDRLVSQPIMDLLRRDARRVYVGKAKADHAVPQSEINQLLLDHARQGQRVLRLKGGDPFIFGRGGEELELLSESDISFQVVPGITAASGCASYAGIPLTHRDYAQSVRFITGHLKDGSINLPWQELVQEGQTLVFYMGLTGVAYICEHLIKNGRAADTPAALIERGSLPEQRVIAATLGDLADKVTDATVKPPTLIVIGEVVLLHKKLNWFAGASDIR